MSHLWVGTPAPLSYIEFTLIREMHWTYEELERTPAQRVAETLAMFDAEAKVRKQREANRKRGRRRIR